MDVIIFDLEATCWNEPDRRSDMETIEIGAVRLDSDMIEDGRFREFVRPICFPVLSPFCVKLTGITQEMLETAEPDRFPVVLSEFSDWIGNAISIFSWGFYDRHQIEQDCRLHGIPVPAWLNRHRSLKHEWIDMAKATGTRNPPRGLRRVLRRLGLSFVGQQHRALDDARNIAKIYQWCRMHHPEQFTDSRKETQ